MGSGGSREGAGRPRGSSKVSFMEKMRLGGQCESLQLEAKEDRASQELANRLKETRRIWEEARSIPIGKRRDWQLSEDFAEDYLDDLKFALQTDQGLIPKDDATWSNTKIPKPARITNIPLVTPKGVREAIIAKVSLLTGYTESQVRESWRFFRKIVQQLEDED